jgi:rfaE bifunctional protein kinase chain/domain
MQKVLVIGDVMVDVWLNSRFTKMSPEDETVKVYHLNDSTSTLGGAANVARQLKALSNYEELEWEVDLFGAIGNEQISINLFKEAGVNWKGIQDEAIYTTVKNRIFEEGKQIVRLDIETPEVPKKIKPTILEALKQLLAENTYEVIVISDYAKGLISKELMEIVKKQGTPIFVDPKLAHMPLYHDVYLLKLNKNDLECLWGVRELNFPEIEEATIGLYEKYNPTRIVITLAGGGSVTYGRSFGEEGKKFEVFRSDYIQKPYVCGAGDVYLSVLVYCYLQNLDEAYSCNIATQTATEFCKQFSSLCKGVQKTYLGN